MMLIYHQKTPALPSFCDRPQVNGSEDRRSARNEWKIAGFFTFPVFEC